MLTCNREGKSTRPLRSLSSCAFVALLVSLGAYSAEGAKARQKASDAKDVGAFKIIVNAKNAVSSMSRARAAGLFMKDVTTWNDGSKAMPIDLAGDSVVRRAFCLDILAKEASAVIRHWEQQQSFGLAGPPPQGATDRKILEYVKANAGAIGYVSGAAATADVKVVTITGFRVIINSSNSTSSMSKAEVKRLLLKKTTKWDDGEKVKPVDQGRTATARALFSDKILGKTVRQVTSYWQQKVFSGRAVPPPQMKSDRDVLDYVKANRGAIGYVSRKAPLKGVKVLRVTE